MDHSERCRLSQLCDLYEERFSYKDKHRCRKCNNLRLCNIKQSDCSLLNLEHPCTVCLVGPVCTLHTRASRPIEICEMLLTYICEKNNIEHDMYIKFITFEREHPVKNFFKAVRKVFESN